jgi:hypothetical protein
MPCAGKRRRIRRRSTTRLEDRTTGSAKRNENRHEEDDRHYELATHNNSPSESNSVARHDQLIISVTFALCTTLPLVPLIVSVYVPLRAGLLAVTFNVELPEPTTEEGLKLELVR